MVLESITLLSKNVEQIFGLVEKVNVEILVNCIVDRVVYGCWNKINLIGKLKREVMCCRSNTKIVGLKRCVPMPMKPKENTEEKLLIIINNTQLISREVVQWREVAVI